MQCPRDQHPLSRETLHDVAIDVCSHCYGVWLDADELGRLAGHFRYPDLNHGPAEALVRSRAFEQEGHTEPADFWQEDDLICPQHHVQLQKHYYAGSTVGIDHCLVCGGFWVDGPELAAIATVVGPDPVEDAMGQLILREADFNAAADRLRQGDPRVPDSFERYLRHPETLLNLLGTVFLGWLGR